MMHSVILIVILVILSGCTPDLDAKAASGELFACTVDADCVPVRGSCGGCGASGRQITINDESTSVPLLVINERYESAWNRRASTQCEGLGVLFAISSHVACYSDPLCVDERCVLVPNASRLCERHHFSCVYVDFDYVSSYDRYGIDCEDVLDICAAYDEERYGWRDRR